MGLRMISKENLKIYVEAHILAEYDISAELRERHDLEMIYNKEGKKIKLTREEIWQYWKKRLESTKLKEVIINE